MLSFFFLLCSRKWGRQLAILRRRRSCWRRQGRGSLSDFWESRRVINLHRRWIGGGWPGAVHLHHGEAGKRLHRVPLLPATAAAWAWAVASTPTPGPTALTMWFCLIILPSSVHPVQEQRNDDGDASITSEGEVIEADFYCVLWASVSTTSARFIGLLLPEPIFVCRCHPRYDVLDDRKNVIPVEVYHHAKEQDWN